jgi:hypothetical protein
MAGKRLHGAVFVVDGDRVENRAVLLQRQRFGEPEAPIRGGRGKRYLL